MAPVDVFSTDSVNGCIPEVVGQGPQYLPLGKNFPRSNVWEIFGTFISFFPEVWCF
jgi:hypothetical protein